MKVKYYQFFLSFIICCIALMFSCNKKDVSSNNSLTENNEIRIIDRLIKVKNYSESINGVFNNSPIKNQSVSKDNNTNYNISQVNADLAQEDLVIVLESLKSQFQGDLSLLTGKPQIIATYSQPSLNNIKSEKVVGISVIIGNQTYRTHHFYLINQGVTTEIQQWNQNQIKLYSFNLLFLATKYGTENTGILILTSTIQDYNYTNLPPINGFNTAVIDDINSPVLRPNNLCGSKNGSKCQDDGQDCVYTTSNFWRCNFVVVVDPNDPKEDPLCPVSATNKIVSTNNLNFSPLDVNGINLIRDSILAKYNYGQKYIEYYILIGRMAYYFDQIDLLSV